MEAFTDFLMDKVVVPGVVIFLALIVLAIPFGIYACIKADQSPTFTLHKDAWACTASHVTTSTTYIMVGKVMVPQTVSSTVCDQWSAR